MFRVSEVLYQFMDIRPFSMHGFYVVVLRDVDEGNQSGFQLVLSLRSSDTAEDDIDALRP